MHRTLSRFFQEKAIVLQNVAGRRSQDAQRFLQVVRCASCVLFRRDAGVVERGGLENRWSLYAARGFESLSLRYLFL